MRASRPQGSRTAASPGRTPSPSLRSLYRALILLTAVITLLALLELVAVLAEATPAEAIALSMFTAVAMIYAGAGVVAWLRRPANPTGTLLVCGAVGLLLGTLANAAHPVLAALGSVLATSVLAVIVHLLLAFPTGRLTGRVAIILAVSGYVIAVLIPLPAIVVADPGGSALAATVQQVLGAALMIATASVLVVRLHRAAPRARRLLLPLYLYGIVAVLGLPLASLLFGPDEGISRVIVQLLLLGGVPIAFLSGVLGGGFAPTRELADLGERLSAPMGGARALSEAVADTLGDPSVRVLLRVADGLVDEDGEPARVSAHPDRGVVDVDIDGRPVGVIEYDGRSDVAEAHVRHAGRIIAVAIDRARLSADLRVSRREVVASRARIVEAADHERFRIAQDLHDGLQMQLVLLGVEAQQIAHAPGASAETAEAATVLRKRIDAAASDLRRLVHDVLPLPLTERGLVAAVDDIVDRMPLPTSVAVEVSSERLPAAASTTAYFVVAEALTNAVKHAKATSVAVVIVEKGLTLRVSVADDGLGGADGSGRGLSGLADRVDALGGDWFLSSPPGGGTRLEVRLPCVS